MNSVLNLMNYALMKIDASAETESHRSALPIVVKERLCKARVPDLIRIATIKLDQQLGCANAADYSLPIKGRVLCTPCGEHR
jgi:hypothetical protein